MQAKIKPLIIVVLLLSLLLSFTLSSVILFGLKQNVAISVIEWDEEDSSADDESNEDADFSTAIFLSDFSFYFTFFDSADYHSLQFSQLIDRCEEILTPPPRC